MGKRVNLTAGRIRDCKCPEGKDYDIPLWDTGAPGLGVLVTKAGHKAFVFRWKQNGGSQRKTIGDVQAWAIDGKGSAREEARRLQRLVDQGIDPRHEAQDRAAALEARREAERRQGATVPDAWTAYIADRKTQRRKDGRTPLWSDRHIANHEALVKPGGEPRGRGRRKGEPATTMPGPLYPLMAMKPPVTADTIKAWLDEQVARGPTQASQAYRAGRAFANWCAESKDHCGMFQPDAFTAKDVKQAAPSVGTKEGDSLQREQLAAWFEAVRRIRNPGIKAFLQIALLTGARREELSSLRWDGVDFQWGSLTIHDKVEGQRVIPLTPYVASLIAALPRRKDKDGNPLPWVFSSVKSDTGRLQEPRIQHVKALQAAGLPHVSIHGLRRSFGSLSEWVEAPVGIVAQIMGHKPSALAEKHYRRRPLDLLRMWHTRIEAWILEQAGIEQPQEGQPGLRVIEGGKTAA